MAVFNSKAPLAGYPRSIANLRKFTGKGAMHDFLRYMARRDVVLFEDDFLGDTINLDMYAVANSAGAGAADFAINVQRDGVIRGATGTTDDGSLSLVGPKIWYGDANCGMEMRLKVSAVTGYNLEVGFIDAVPGSNGSGISDVDTPAATATDCALWQIDTDQTLATAAFVTAGTSFTTTATTLPSGYTNLTAATFSTIRIQLIGDTAYCWVDGLLVASHTGSKVEGGNALALWVYARTRNTTTKTVDIDYIQMWQDRSV